MDSQIMNHKRKKKVCQKLQIIVFLLLKLSGPLSTMYKPSYPWKLLKVAGLGEKSRRYECAALC